MEILISTNYDRLQQKILTLISEILDKDHFSLEDKIIIENSVTIWLGTTLYKPELFDEFKAFKKGEKTAEDFILNGLVFCREDKTRQDFYQGIAALSRAYEPSKRLSMIKYFMGILGANF